MASAWTVAFWRARRAARAPQTKSRKLHTIFELIVLGLVLFLVCWGRVYLGYHSWPQVLAGAVAGTLFTLAWEAAGQPVLAQLAAHFFHTKQN